MSPPSRVTRKSEPLHRFEVLLPGLVSERSPGTGQRHPRVLPVAGRAAWPACDGDRETGALLVHRARGRAVAGSLPGCVLVVSPGACVAGCRGRSRSGGCHVALGATSSVPGARCCHGSVASCGRKA